MTSYTEFLASGLEWLRYQRGCYITAWERSPWEFAHHKPDLIGIDSTRKCIEIEIKRSVADFKNDAEKAIWNSRDLFKQAWPAQFYYFVDPAIVDKVRPFVRDGFGLITLAPESERPTIYGNRDIQVVKKATKQKDAKPLSVRQLFNMVRHQSGSMAALMAWVKERDRLKSVPAEPQDLRVVRSSEFKQEPQPLPLGGGHDYTSP
jgi:hypothetical protein